MRIRLIPPAAVALLALAATAPAMPIVAYTGTGATRGGAGGNLNIGREFTVSGSGITVTDLGIWDWQGDGLVDQHVITLFAISPLGSNPATKTPLASVTVPSGTAAELDSGIRFAALDMALHLAAGDYAVVAYGTNNTRDPYGDGGGLPAAGNNVADYRFDPFQFTSATSPSFPTGGDSNNHSSASFRFEVGDTTVPEPATLSLLALGGLGLLRRRKRARM